jgi:hypothetical protein
MKSNIKGIRTKITFCATALLAACLFTGAANAQTVHGKFTLDNTTRWGKAVLPAGEYQLTFNPAREPGIVAISDAKTGKKVALIYTAITEGAGKGGSALFVGQRGRQRVIYSFRLAELGRTFIYDPALAHGRGVLEASDTQTVPVLDAKK